MAKISAAELNLNGQNKIYEGKAKSLYRTAEADVLIQAFKNSATAFNGVKKAEIENKGRLNNAISSFIYEYLNEKGIPTHFLEQLDETHQKIKSLKMAPLEVVVRNKVAGSLAKKTGKPEGEVIEPTLIEFYLKDDAKGDPQIQESEAIPLAKGEENLKRMKLMALEVNQLLQKLFSKAQIDLIDFKLEFGWDSEAQLILGDEISPDTCRLWDAQTGEKLDKDRFRFDLGDLIEGYQKVWDRLQKLS